MKVDPRYPNNPTYKGTLDNFEATRNIGRNYAIRLWSYFKAPMSGNYQFVVNCDDFCNLYIADNRDAKQHEIIKTNDWVNLYQWHK